MARRKPAPKKRAATALAAAPGFRDTFERAAIGIGHVRNGVLLRVNPKLCKILGRNANSLVGRTVRELSFPGDGDVTTPHLGRLLAGRIENFSVEKRYLHRSGKPVWVRLTVALVRTASGRPDYEIAMFEDIGERRHAEQALQESEARFRQLVEDSPDPILLLAEERVAFANPAALRLFGATQPAELLGRSADDCVAPAFRELSRARREVLAAAEEVVPQVEMELVRLDGSLVAAEVAARRVTVGGRPATQIVARDITERKRADAALRDSEERFRSLTELSSDWYWEQDEQFRFTFMSGSQMLQDKTGIGVDEHLGRTRWDVPALNLSDEDWERHRRQLARHEPFVDFEIRRPDSKGREHWSSISGRPVFDSEGRFRGYRGTGRDITERKRAEHALRDAEARYRSLFEMAPDAIIVTRKGVTLYVNPAACLLFGLAGPEQMGNRSVLDFVHPDSRALATARHLEVRSRPMHAPFAQRHMVRADGSDFYAEVGAVSFEVDGEMMVQNIVRDITERMHTEQALRESEERFQLAVRGSLAGIWDWNVVTDDYYISPRFKEMLGYQDAEMPNERSSFMSRLHPEDLPRVDSARARHFEERVPFAVDYRLRRKDGSYIWCRAIGHAVWDAGGKPVRFAGSTTDIDAHKRAEEKLAQLAHHDALTGLPNRHLLRDRLTHALAAGRRNDWSIGVMFIDLDGFKVVNDTLGHENGDKLLAEVGRRLVRSTRGGDTVARLGGDEFAVILPDLPDAQAAGMVAQKILDAVAVPFELEGRDVRVDASIGIAVFPLDGDDHDGLMRSADAAMYRAKEKGRGNYQFCEQVGRPPGDGGAGAPLATDQASGARALSAARSKPATRL